MKKLGILVYSLSVCQKGLLIASQCNKLVQQRKDIDLILYYEDYSILPELIQFCMMQNRQAWGIKSNMMAVDLSSVIALLNFNTEGTLLYYPQELDWMHYPNNATFYKEIYDNNKVKIISRSQSHFDTIAKVWNKPLDIIEDFNYEQLASIVDKYCI